MLIEYVKKSNSKITYALKDNSKITICLKINNSKISNCLQNIPNF